MEWIREENKYSLLQKLAIKIIRQGPLPKHIALIMDGNRRFAREHGLQKKQGHQKGFLKVGEVLEWCRDIGINEVTVYAFSIENFNRSPDEVECLMQLAREKFEKLISEAHHLRKYGVRVRVIGDLDLLPKDVQQMAANIMSMTRLHQQSFLNICFSYTSRYEMTSAVNLAANALASGILKPHDVTPELLNECMYTYESPIPDLLIRTSGEVRLSDFLLWQTQHSCVHFERVLWPDFTLWHLIWAVFSFQCDTQQLKNDLQLMSSSQTEERNCDYEDRINNFRQFVKVHHERQLLKIADDSAVM